MSIEERIQAFSTLGLFLGQFKNSKKSPALKKLNEQFYHLMETELETAQIKNRWFIKENLLFAIDAWACLLKETLLTKWVLNYTFPFPTLNIGVVQAGNIPLVGFHDFLSILISGHNFIGKASSKDENLPQFISKVLIAIDSRFQERIQWQERLNNIDAVIATGSNNTARYFDYYFGKKPNIIRKNRSSWAIITGKETEEELGLLGKDIFSYYGLGCRNISKLFVPDNYDFKYFFEAIEPYRAVYNNNKYANNFDYNQSVYLMNQIKFLENGFFIVKEDIAFHSPLSVAFYENYSSLKLVEERIKTQAEDIQLVCSAKGKVKNTIPFGEAQEPQLWDYADNIDTLDFLSKLKKS